MPFATSSENFNQLLDRIVTYMTGPDAERIARLDVRMITDDPAVWGNTPYLRRALTVRLKNLNQQWSATDAIKPTVKVHVLGSNLDGHVIAYLGSQCNSEELAYLILRRTGLEWRGPLSAEEKGLTALYDHTVKSAFADGLGANAAMLRYAIDEIAQQVCSTRGDDMAVQLLRHELWLAENGTQKNADIISAFCNVYGYLAALAGCHNLHLEDVLAAARTHLKQEG